MNDLSTPSGTFTATPALNRIFVLARSVFALLGFAVATVVALPQTRDGILNQFHALAWKPEVRVALAPAAEALETGGPAAPTRDLMSSPGDLQETGFAAGQEARAVHAVAHDPGREAARAALTQYIANRYRVADEVVSNIVRTAYRAANANAIDPLIVLAVVATESRYNPIAESVVGAKGLMQIIAKFHPEKLADHGGEDALFEPEVNIQVGTQILHEYLRRYGDLETALQVYAGAIDDSDARYARKVLAERARLKQALERSQRVA
jgi:soluble lytic murein transglycosylase-like protein